MASCSVPAGADPMDPLYAGEQHTFQGIGRRPYAPSHLEAVETGGSISIDWIRRTHIPDYKITKVDELLPWIGSAPP